MLPRLETPRLALRPLVRADLEAWLAMDLEPEVARFIWGEPPDPKRHLPARNGVWLLFGSCDISWLEDCFGEVASDSDRRKLVCKCCG